MVFFLSLTNGGSEKAFQLGCFVGSSGNVFFKYNGTQNYTGSANIAPGQVFSLRVIASPSGDDAKPYRIQCFVNSTSVFEFNYASPGGTTNYCGIRYDNAASSANYINFANLRLTNNV